MRNRFADNLKFLRKNDCVSQSHLALHMNKGQTTIANWENGNSEPSLDELIELSNFFDISPTVLLLGELENFNLIINPNANLKGKKVVKYHNQIETTGVVNEPDENLSWLLLQEVRRNSQNIDQLRVLIEKLVTK